ncbi:MAG: hypothetical protein MK160_16395 [Rhodobacteraceae bacterium]|nr:hypothetical protein [Paracoccaceae bacterium]
MFSQLKLSYAALTAIPLVWMFAVRAYLNANHAVARPGSALMEYGHQLYSVAMTGFNGGW